MNEARDEDFTEPGRLLFAGPCDFIFASAKSGDLPPIGPPEIAFAGRSNVGKSSLLNALTGRKALARVSNTPGRTQQLNFFALGAAPGAEPLRLVDMPGYGYAAVGKEKIANWTRLMEEFLRGRASLIRVFVLIDSRRGVKDLDEQMFDLLDRAAVSYQIVLTKHDELKVSEREAAVAAVEAALAKRPAAFPRLAVTSSRSGDGVAELRAGIARLLAERNA
ncbi:YihA family ribosome biogenesis GTP-binding protein [Methylosinus sp. R-45379]|uniref:ribosome biogenesis GTP-binding protein YihA/YsxC n=1 Tax=Methylosinus sp. R-45379 TaxID=980563 RepID=UPI0007C98512|nr:ribosome biogenesis GTP-binding protein YihA/YsxC [Methylosinus sp. R-45379]OAI22683.1 YihA family ribosome biogenesis GTP-binding protein [Methylosinus sp. R-45379]